MVDITETMGMLVNGRIIIYFCFLRAEHIVGLQCMLTAVD